MKSRFLAFFSAASLLSCSLSAKTNKISVNQLIINDPDYQDSMAYIMAHDTLFRSYAQTTHTAITSPKISKNGTAVRYITNLNDSSLYYLLSSCGTCISSFTSYPHYVGQYHELDSNKKFIFNAGAKAINSTPNLPLLTPKKPKISQKEDYTIIVKEKLIEDIEIKKSYNLNNRTITIYSNTNIVQKNLENDELNSVHQQNMDNLINYWNERLTP